MDGNKWRLFCLDLSFIGWELLCALPMYAGYFLFLNNFSGSEAMAISIVLLLAIPLSIGFSSCAPMRKQHGPLSTGSALCCTEALQRLRRFP